MSTSWEAISRSTAKKYLNFYKTRRFMTKIILASDDDDDGFDDNDSDDGNFISN
jgi:hypothetical protein